MLIVPSTESLSMICAVLVCPAVTATLSFPVLDFDMLESTSRLVLPLLMVSLSKRLRPPWYHEYPSTS